MTTETLREVYEELDGDLEKISERLNIPYDELMVLFSSATAEAPIVEPPRRRVPPADLGQPNLRRYITSVRHCDNPVWPLADLSKIEAGRVKYEAGTHEIAQGRDRDWFVLYLIPRSTRAGARKYFSAE